MDPYIEKQDNSALLIHKETSDVGSVNELLHIVHDIGQECLRQDGSSQTKEHKAASKMVQLADNLLKQTNILNPASMEAFRQDLLMIRYLVSLIQVEITCTGKLLQQKAGSGPSSRVSSS